MPLMLRVSMGLLVCPNPIKKKNYYLRQSVVSAASACAGGPAVACKAPCKTSTHRENTLVNCAAPETAGSISASLYTTTTILHHTEAINRFSNFVKRDWSLIQALHKGRGGVGRTVSTRTTKLRQPRALAV